MSNPQFTAHNYISQNTKTSTELDANTIMYIVPEKPLGTTTHVLLK